MSPVAIVLAVENEPWIKRLPADEASKIPKWEMLPQDAVAAGNSIAAELSAVPLEAALNVTDWRV